MEKIRMTMQGALAALPACRLAAPADWTIRYGEQWAVVGPNGAGKTLLADMLQGRLRLLQGEIRWSNSNAALTAHSIAFKDIHSHIDSRNAYYQQRWNATETEDAPLASAFLPPDSLDASSPTLLPPSGFASSGLLQRLGVLPLLDRKIICLSGGELRRLLIVRALLNRPELLILDNPYIGLDAEGRRTLSALLREMAALDSPQTLLILPDTDELPDTVTHVLPMYGKRCLPPLTREAFLRDDTLHRTLFPAAPARPLPPPALQILSHAPQTSFPPSTPQTPTPSHCLTLRMEKVTVRYAGRTILSDIDWEVRNGEKWALLGPNGSGKSTLLSLIYADHPQAYANRLYLFDRRRGSGESIWDIKQRIGFVSPEIHLYYNENVPTRQIVASGYFDTIGLFRRCTPRQESGAEAWMSLFGIRRLADRPFLTLSSGEQRLALLARAFVKDPALLILDEPLHGLDAANKRLATDVIERFCRRPDKTLIYVTHYPAELPPCITHHFNL